MCETIKRTYITRLTSLSQRQRNPLPPFFANGNFGNGNVKCYNIPTHSVMYSVLKQPIERSPVVHADIWCISLFNMVDPEQHSSAH